MALFSEVFGVDPMIMEKYGAFDISLSSDLPLFIDPFLLFDSQDDKYLAWHEDIIDYLSFLREKSVQGPSSKHHIRYYYGFPEVRQNWLGFTQFSNKGRGLGPLFGRTLDGSLNSIFSNFGKESITQSGHLEKLCLIKEGVGRDSISDFTTNLVKHRLLTYTENFARLHMEQKHLKNIVVKRAYFDYSSGIWKSKRYTLPYINHDYVLLTPKDILTRDESWINRTDLYENFDLIPSSIDNESFRMEISNHFRSQLDRRSKKKDRVEAAINTVKKYPELIDYYIRYKEANGTTARNISLAKVTETQRIFNNQLTEIVDDLESKTSFYTKKDGSYIECLEKVNYFKNYIENNDGYKVVQAALHVVRKEEVVQLFFGLAWFGSNYDLNREVNNGRGAVDFKVSNGNKDKTLIEFKLASNSSLEKNLKNQLEIYQKANNTSNGIKVIFVANEKESKDVEVLLTKLGLKNKENVIVIDARSDNKPSASKA